MNRFQKATLLIKELGLKQLMPYAAYQAKLRSGVLERQTPSQGWEVQIAPSALNQLHVPFPKITGNQLIENGIKGTSVLAEAEMILKGGYRPFGGDPARLSFALPQSPLEHWIHYGSTLAGQDIKLIWEPARFTWVYPLIEAFVLTGDERYPECFWQRLEEFIQMNPVNLGPNWASAQEVALRVLPLIFALNTFQDAAASSSVRKQHLISLLLQSAGRIPPTLAYARSQNNNHLLSEALGLIVLGQLFAEVHPLAAKWQSLGFSEFEKALRTQIQPDGTYSQHSTNYHRLMLQLALVFYAYAQSNSRRIDPELLSRLAAATHWLAGQVDATSGKATNLGHNDGTFLLPFGATAYGDYRPTLQAASLAFLGKPAFKPGVWDALSNWNGLPVSVPLDQPGETTLSSPAIRRVGSRDSWGTLRAVTFHSRPAHADQLTVDLWWQGTNIAMDAGTYLYNADPPWDNALSQTCVHNTLTLNGQDQMLRAGRFLWLNRVNAQILPSSGANSVAAQLLPRSKPQIRHTRTLTVLPDEGFEVMDELTSLDPDKKSFTADLQWLLPDWRYTWLPLGIQLEQEDRVIGLTFEVTSNQADALPMQFSLVRAGEALKGELCNPIRGWFSPTYNQKVPALSLVLRISSTQSLTLLSRWKCFTRTSKSG